ncbi:hypothetical protein [Nitrospirillum iridis]|uniref:Uncharacterized protein n=1 Tax=Nitrospirillum iridis TaxID=765888 RepID=A0A7X0AY45_9PROT|nr:hypothetical protein [Nitrospirillum iridis]MBB6252273.1 hypothetical protein [Nitrospirillum iridis]
MSITILDHERFHAWCLQWVTRHGAEIAPFRMGLVLLSHHAARLFHLQGKTVRAGALDRMTTSLVPPAITESRRWRTERQAALRAFARGDGAAFLRHPNAGWAVPRTTPWGIWGNPDLCGALWGISQRREIDRQFKRPAGPPLDPALIDLLIVQAARQIGFGRDGATRGRHAATLLSVLLVLDGHLHAAATAAAVAVLFDPKSRPAHETLAEALITLDSADPDAAYHRSVARYLDPRT